MVMVNKSTTNANLGGNGLRDWMAQRVTSLILAAYIIFLFSFFIANPNLQYYAWQTLFANSWMRIFSVLFLLSLVWHAWIGIWTIATDYIKPIMIRLIFQFIVIIALATYFVWGVQILWGV
jgi:succinate dehydrogenase / fumarate reductase membrane anchor subunit